MSGRFDAMHHMLKKESDIPHQYATILKLDVYRWRAAYAAGLRPMGNWDMGQDVARILVHRPFSLGMREGNAETLNDRQTENASCT